MIMNGEERYIDMVTATFPRFEVPTVARTLSWHIGERQDSFQKACVSCARDEEFKYHL